MTEDNKLEWKEENLKYVGKTLKAQSKEGSEREWKIFKLNFDVGKQFPFTINCFNTLGSKEDYEGVTFKELEEGETYLVKYKVEKEAFESHGKKHDNRTVYYVGESTAPARTGNEQPSTAPAKEEISVEELLPLFEKKYVENLEGKKDSPTQFIVTWFNRRYSDEFSKVAAYAKQRTKTPSLEEVQNKPRNDESIPEEDIDLSKGDIV